MLSELTRLRVANVCYAAVSGLFARFSNKSNRGPNFTWDWFIDHCRENADLWIIIHGVKMTKKNKDEVIEFARHCAEEIATTLVNHVDIKLKQKGNQNVDQ